MAGPPPGLTDRGGPLGDEPAGHLLTTLMGDYWYASPEFVPSAALVALLAQFGVGEAATRAALSRQTRLGRLEGIRRGRTTAYRLAPRLVPAAVAHSRTLMRYGAEPRPWDGQWTCVVFSIPEARRHLRPALRQRLRRMGLGPLFDGFWITPWAPLDAIDEALADLGVVEAAVFRVTEVARRGRVDLTGAWDLPALRAGYAGLVDQLTELLERLRRGEVGPAEALVARTAATARWRVLVADDPQLPDELLPDGWPLGEARRLFGAAYDELGPLAEVRARQVVGADEALDWPPPRAHRVADRFAEG
ncbi:MAG TPA: PaaX family transcriptional regulator C-terminal domain-containing protein [Acidimicrobiales bacterium]|nr:PaaX family transcriptional regulator C-terminal domain-containing protein [Acidimicrobiales bacterium]